jgi:hypothetical protein
MRLPRYERKRMNVRPRPSKKEKLSIWEELNRPLVIWLLTASIGGLVTALYTNHQNCVRDSAATVSHYNRMAAEIDFRRRQIATNIRALTSVDGVPDALKRVNYLYPEFRDTPIAALEKESASMNPTTKPDAMFVAITTSLLQTFAGSLTMYRLWGYWSAYHPTI